MKLSERGPQAYFPRTIVYDASPAAAWAWFDVDCSAVVGAREALVLLRVLCVGGAGTFFTRVNGETVTHTVAAGADCASINAGEKAYIIGFTDANGILEVMTSQAGNTYTVTVEAACHG